MDLAREKAEISANAGSKYGQFALAEYDVKVTRGITKETVANFERAARQNYFRAKNVLGDHHPARAGSKEADKLFLLAEAQIWKNTALSRASAHGND